MAAMNDDYLQPYREAAKQYGSGFDVTLWATPRTQAIRFAVIAQMIDLTGKTVLDAGCSRGDFAAYLHAAGVSFGRFVGVDGVDEVVEIASGRGLERCRFVAGDFVQRPELLATDRPEVVTISGSLNTMRLETALAVLEGAWAGASEALIFNFLSDRAGDRAPRQSHPAHRLPLMELLDWALSKSWDVQLRQDYFEYGHDATILVRHAGRR